MPLDKGSDFDGQREEKKAAKIPSDRKGVLEWPMMALARHENSFR